MSERPEPPTERLPEPLRCDVDTKSRGKRLSKTVILCFSLSRAAACIFLTVSLPLAFRASFERLLALGRPADPLGSASGILGEVRDGARLLIERWWGVAPHCTHAFH